MHSFRLFLVRLFFRFSVIYITWFLVLPKVKLLAYPVGFDNISFLVLYPLRIRKPIIDIWDKAEEMEYVYDWLSSDRYEIKDYDVSKIKRAIEREGEREKDGGKVA